MAKSIKKTVPEKFNGTEVDFFKEEKKMLWKHRVILNIIGLLEIVVLAGCSQVVKAPVTSINTVIAAPSVPTQFITYAVRPGDTLGGIASQNHMSYFKLAEVNHIPAPYSVDVGQILKIPNRHFMAEQVAEQESTYGGSAHALEAQQSLPAQSLNLTKYANTSGKIYVPAEQVTPAPTVGNSKAQTIATQLVNQASSPPPAAGKNTSQTVHSASSAIVNAAIPRANLSTNKMTVNDQVAWSWPVSGQITEKFGEGTGIVAKGIQISTSSATNVLAAANGTVIYSGVGAHGYGKMIILKSDNNFLTAYSNLSSLEAKQGQVLQRGQVLGTVGAVSGAVGSPAILHFEVRKFGNPVDPLSYMPSI